MELQRDQLISAIQHAMVRRKRPSAALRALAELDFPLAITTNYDRLFEKALAQADKSPRIGIYDPEGAKPTPDFPEDERPILFKIHGDVDSGNTVVITEQDYIKFTLRMGDSGSFHPIPDTVRYNLRQKPTLFIGYSLNDYNLRLLFETLNWKLDPALNARKAGYVVDPNPDPLVFEQFGRREYSVQFIVQDLWAFIPELYRRVKRREMPV